MPRPQVTVHVSSKGLQYVPGINLVVGPRYSDGLGIDEGGRVFIDPALPGLLALKSDPVTGRVYAEIDPEPPALPVGLDGTRPFYEKE